MADIDYSPLDAKEYSCKPVSCPLSTINRLKLSKKKNNSVVKNHRSRIEPNYSIVSFKEYLIQYIHLYIKEGY